MARLKSDEHFRTVHRPADRYVATGDRHPAWRSAGLSRTSSLCAARGRLPHRAGHHAASRREPGYRGDTDYRIAGAPVRPDPRAGHDDLAKFRGHQPDHPAVQSRPQHGFGRAGRAGGDQRRRGDVAREPPVSAGLRQGQSGRCTNPDAGADLRDFTDRQGQRRRRYIVAAETVRDRRCRARHCTGRTAAGGAGARRSGAAGRLRPGAGGRAHRRRQCQRERRQRRLRRPSPCLRTWRKRSAYRPRGLPVAGDRLAQRRAPTTVGRRQRDQRGGERSRRRMVRWISLRP